MFGPFHINPPMKNQGLKCISGHVGGCHPSQLHITPSLLLFYFVWPFSLVFNKVTAFFRVPLWPSTSLKSTNSLIIIQTVVLSKHMKNCALLRQVVK